MIFISRLEAGEDWRRPAGFIHHRKGSKMGTTELIILIVVLILVFGGGGGYYWSRRR